MSSAYRRELEVALAAAQEAGAYLRDAYEAFVPIPDAPATISTDADRQSQDKILASLVAVFPDDAYLAEEATPLYASLSHQGERCWVIDPIDGTRGFARKNGEFSLMIGLVVAGQPVVGVVYEPIPDRYTYAVIHQGCFCRHGMAEPVPMVCGGVNRLQDARLVISHLKRGVPAVVVDALKPLDVRETYSAGVKLAMVARGESDIYVIEPRNPYCDWDVCAGEILVREAGGIVTRHDGSSIHYPGPGKHSTGLVAAAPSIHAAAVRALNL